MAGVITALATFFAVHAASSSQTLSQPAQAPPQVSASVNLASVASRLDTAQVSSDLSSQDQATALANRCASGSADDSMTLLNVLIGECDQGYGIGCDALYEVSPPGSDLEAYGATCGGRFDAEYRDRCREL